MQISQKVSSGCDHCYAETIAERFRGGPAFPNGFDMQLREHKLTEPLRWRKPSKVFVNSMSDLFHSAVPDEYIARVFAVMALAEKHTFQVLTKRHARMRSLLNSPDFIQSVADTVAFDDDLPADGGAFSVADWPLPNVWLGVSAEDQRWADIRIPALLDSPAAARFVSVEPQLGPIVLSGDALGHYYGGDPREDERGLDWVIVGGESGHGIRTTPPGTADDPATPSHGARPMHPDWARSLRDQCVQAGVPFFFKQWGTWMPLAHPNDDGADLYVQREDGRTATDDDMFHITSGHWWGVQRVGKKRAGRMLDGRTWDEMPKRSRASAW